MAASADGNKLVAAPALGPIYTSTDSGATWALTSAPMGGPVASSADGSVLVAAEWGFGICVSTNTGADWIRTSAPAAQHWNAVAASANGRKLIAAASEGIYSSTDSGATWMLSSPPLGSDWSAIALSADGSLLTAAGSGGAYMCQLAPTPFLSVTPTPDGLRISWRVPSAKLVLQESTDLNLKTWTKVSAPSTLNLTTLRFELTVPFDSTCRVYRLGPEPSALVQ